jgi:hypothetical protein
MICICVLAVSNIAPAYAQGVLIVNTDILEDENTLILDADDTGGDISLQFGNTLNKYLKWDDAGSAFAFNDDVDFEGNELKNFKIDNLISSPICDSTTKGRIYHNTTDTYTYICDGSSWNILSKISGVDSNTFTIDQDDTGGDVALQFGSILAEALIWDDSEGRFYFSDDLMVNGDLLPAIDDVYSLGSETYRWTTIHATSGITVENGDIYVGEGGFVVSFNNGETGAGNTILRGNVVQVDLDPEEINAVELTISKNDQPIGVAVNDSAYGELTEVVIIGKAEVKCVGSESVGDLIQSSNTDGYAESGANATKIIGTAVTDCTGPLGTLEAIIHLE